MVQLDSLYMAFTRHQTWMEVSGSSQRFAIRLGADAGVLRTLVSTTRIVEGGLMSEHMGKLIGRSSTLALGVCRP